MNVRPVGDSAGISDIAWARQALEEWARQALEE